MSTFNQCSHLYTPEAIAAAVGTYNSILESGLDPLSTMLNMQESLQIKLAREKPTYNVDPKNLETCGDILTWCRKQDDYIADETRELYTSLGGMSNGEKAASSVWKPWKAQHGEMFNKRFDDLSPEDQIEVKMEMIDQLHFFMNKFIALGMSSEDIFVYYYLKNAENFDRQNRGY